MVRIFKVSLLLMLIILMSACGSKEGTAKLQSSGSENQASEETEGEEQNEQVKKEEKEGAEKAEALDAVASEFYNGYSGSLKGLQLMKGAFLVEATEKEQFLVVNGVTVNALQDEEPANFWNKVKDFDKEDVVQVPEFQSAADPSVLGLDFTIDTPKEEVLKSLGEPLEISGYLGGEALYYDQFAYIFSMADNTLSAASVYGEDTIVHGTHVGMTPNEVKNVLGEPDSKGISEMTGLWVFTHDFGDYRLDFSSKSNNKPVTEILYLKNFKENPATNQSNSEQPTEAPALEFYDVEFVQSSSNYYTVTFKLRNNTDQVVQDIDIRATFSDINGKPLTSADTSFWEIPAGQYKQDDILIEFDPTIDSVNLDVIN